MNPKDTDRLCGHHTATYAIFPASYLYTVGVFKWMMLSKFMCGGGGLSVY